MANKKTTLNQLIIGSSFTNQRSWNVELDFAAAGNAATAEAPANGTNRISAYDQYEVVTADVATGYSAGDIITIEEVDYVSSSPDTDVVVDGAGAAAAGIVTAKALNVTDPAINYVVMGDAKESVGFSYLIQSQSSVNYDPNGGGPGVPSWTPVNDLPAGSRGVIFSNDTAVTLDVTFKVGDIYSVDPATGVETRGSYTLDLALYAPVLGETYTIATLEAGDAITISGLGTEVTDPAGPTTEVCQLVVLNNDASGDDLLTDITASVFLG